MTDVLFQLAAELRRKGHPEMALSLPDALWLARLLPPASDDARPPIEPSEVAGRDETRPIDQPPAVSRDADEQPAPASRTTAATPPSWRIETFEVDVPELSRDRLPVGMLVPREHAGGQPARRGMEIGIPAPPGLQDPDEFGRRLKPLRRFRRNRLRPLLDVVRTVERICDEEIWDLVLKYPYDRCLNLTWIVDSGGSMNLWRQIGSELFVACRDSGAFRSCRAYRWHVDEQWNTSFTPLDARAWADALPSRPDWPETGPDGLLAIFSDCSAGRWYRKTTREQLCKLGRQTQILIVNPLPERMWGRTVLGQAVESDLRSPTPAAPAGRLQVCRTDEHRYSPSDEQKLTLLAVSADPDHLLGWSRFVAGRRPVYPGFSLELTPTPMPSVEAAEISAQQRLDRFRRYASRGARELARLTAAVPLITPRFIRLVRQDMLDAEFAPSHLHEAELLLSPLLHVVDEGGPARERIYDFYPGVRQRLLEQTPVEHVRQVFHYFVDLDVRADLLRSTSLGEYGANLLRLDDPDTDCTVHPLSEIPTELILRRLGGEYRRLLEDARKSSLQLELNSHLRRAEQAREVLDWTTALSALDQARDLIAADPDRWGRARPLVEELLGVYRGLLQLPELVAGAAAEREAFVEPVTGMVLAPIAAGSFWIGSPESEAGRFPDEGPRHRVTLSHDFWMGIYPVTQSQYRAVIGANPSRFQGENRPVENVSWEDAVAFCEKLTQLAAAARGLPDGYVFRLPTEAEWEYCCRAGTETATSFGNDLSSHQANFNGNYPCGDAEKGPYFEQTSDVGRYPANAWGLYDMHGNVREWCLDAADGKGGTVKTDTYVEDVVDPLCQVGRGRVYRGGGWLVNGGRCRSACRFAHAPGRRRDYLGFRVCLALAPAKGRSGTVTETGA